LRARAQGQNPRAGQISKNLQGALKTFLAAPAWLHAGIGPVLCSLVISYRPRCPIHDVKDRDGWFRHPSEEGDFYPKIQ
jgi:hypothetical protein